MLQIFNQNKKYIVSGSPSNARSESRKLRFVSAAIAQFLDLALLLLVVVTVRPDHLHFGVKDGPWCCTETCSHSKKEEHARFIYIHHKH